MSLVSSTIEQRKIQREILFEIRALLAQNEDEFQSLSYLVCCFALDVVILVTSV